MFISLFKPVVKKCFTDEWEKEEIDKIMWFGHEFNKIIKKSKQVSFEMLFLRWFGFSETLFEAVPKSRSNGSKSVITFSF